MSGFFEAIEGIAAYLSESSLVFLVILGVVAVVAIRLGPDIIRAVVEIRRIDKEHDTRMAQLHLLISRETLGQRHREAAGHDTAQGSEHHD